MNKHLRNILIGILSLIYMGVITSCSNVKLVYEGYDDFEDSVSVYYCETVNDVYEFFKSKKLYNNKNSWDDFFYEKIRNEYNVLHGDDFFKNDFLGRRIKDEIKEGYYVAKYEDTSIICYVKLKEKDYTWKELFTYQGYIDDFEAYQGLCNWPFPFQKVIWYWLRGELEEKPNISESELEEFKSVYHEVFESDKKYNCKFIDIEKSWESNVIEDFEE